MKQENTVVRFGRFNHPHREFCFLAEWARSFRRRRSRNPELVAQRAEVIRRLSDARRRNRVTVKLFRRSKLEGEKLVAYRVRSSAANQKYNAKNQTGRRADNCARTIARRKTDPVFKLAHRMRHRLYMLVKSGTASRVRGAELCGCSCQEVKAHLEARFLPGMTWENYGPVWHIDHKKPCARFNLLDPEQVKACFHFTNLQPLWALDNIRKKDRYYGD